MLITKKEIKNLKKSFKKGLTIMDEYDILSKLSARVPRKEGKRQAGRKKDLKKLLKNPLTRANRCDIIVESPESDGKSQAWSLKIEQQRDEVQSE